MSSGKWKDSDKMVNAKTEAEAVSLAAAWLHKKPLDDGLAERKPLNKPAVDAVPMAKKISGHKAERESKTGIASYDKTKGCGKGNHKFTAFGSYAVCTKCGSRKTLSKAKPKRHITAHDKAVDRANLKHARAARRKLERE